MPFVAPMYSVGDVVYIKESAALGFLEAYAVEGVGYLQDGTVIYTLVSSLRPPTAAQSIGDRVTGQRLLPVQFLETDLILLCDALDLAVVNLQRQLNSLESMRDAHGCIEEGTESDNGTG